MILGSLADDAVEAQHGIRALHPHIDQLDAHDLPAVPYEVKGEIVGVLGVVGPTRIAYENVIPVVDITAKLLTSALNTRK